MTPTRRSLLAGLAAAPLTRASPKGHHGMSFRRSIVRISELIADKVTGLLIIGGDIQGTTIEGGTITGATVQTAATDNRVVIVDHLDAFNNPTGYVQAFSGDPTETQPAQLFNTETGGGAPPVLTLESALTAAQPTPAAVVLLAGATQGEGFLDGQFRATGSLIIGAFPAGDAIAGLEFGTLTANADVNGAVTVNHTLGVNPGAVLLTPRMRNKYCYVFSLSATQFVVRFLDADTNTPVVAGVSCSFFWQAMA